MAIRRSVSDLTGEIIVQDASITTASSSITPGDATPSVSNVWYLKTANTGATTITDFDNPNGQFHHIVVFFNDALTTIAHDATKIDMPGDINVVFAAGDIAEFIYVGTVWYCWSQRIG